MKKIAKGMRNDPSGGQDVQSVSDFGWRKPQNTQKRVHMIIFCTTLSISPHKNADLLMQIGEELSENYGVYYLPSDFKKKNGYKKKY